MNDQIAFEFVTGMVLPIVVDQINKKIADENVRYLVSVGVCIVVAVAFNYQKLSLQNIAASAGIIFAAAQSVYKLGWKNSELRQKFL